MNAPGTCKCKGHFGGEICIRCEDGWQGDFCDTGYYNLLLDSLSFLILKILQLYARLTVKMETAQSLAHVCATQDGMESTVPSVSQFYCSCNCAFNEMADIHCNDSTGIGSFALVRHVGTGSVWHSATFGRCFTCLRP